VADQFYVFLSLRLDKAHNKYVFEVTEDGDIARSCEMK
jgi:hypothetical protein